MTYNQLLSKYKQEIKEYNIDIGTIKYYLYELCQYYNIDLYLNIDKEVDTRIYKLFIDNINRIYKYEPIAYILGYCWFYGYRIIVNKDVLIPRYETEELVVNVLNYLDKYYQDYDHISLGDICCGSGAISIALQKEEPKLTIYSSDISKEAIDIALINSKENDCHIKYYIGDMLDPIINDRIKLDIVVCNPPYIGDNEILDESIINYEPDIALFGGVKGLKYYKELLSKIDLVINPKGLIALEIGFQQSKDIVDLINFYITNCDIEIIKDINNKERMIFIKLK